VTEKVKVLFIMGMTRSGSTLLESLLGGIDGFFPTGETHMLWRGLLQGFRCGCRQLVASCTLWSQVLDAVADGSHPADPREVWRWQLAEARILHTPRLMSIRSWPETGRPLLNQYVRLLTRLYGAVRDLTQARVIVDSSKSPSVAEILRHLDQIDLYVVHLVRDPRAVAYSWRRGTPDPELPQLRPYRPGPVRSTARWIATNLLGDAVRRRLGVERSMLLRYEELAEKPVAAVRRIAELVGEDDAELPFLSERVAYLTDNHMVSGNRSRFQTGEVAVQLDTQWITEGWRLHRGVVTALALPWLHRYGYPIRRTRVH
jgi:hypothetical protein